MTAATAIAGPTVITDRRCCDSAAIACAADLGVVVAELVLPELVVFLDGPPAARDISPPGRQREQHAILIMQMDPVLTPVLPVRDELEVLAEHRATAPAGSPERVCRALEPASPAPS
jgi:hypothetical protein